MKLPCEATAEMAEEIAEPWTAYSARRSTRGIEAGACVREAGEEDDIVMMGRGTTEGA